jgi:uncharacterized membrane protein YkoI
MASTRSWQATLAVVLGVAPTLVRADGPNVAAQVQQALALARITLAQAVETAQKEVPGDPIVDAELKWNRAPAYFEAELLGAERLKEMRIDPLTGKLLGTDDQKLDLGSPVRASLTNLRQALAGAKLSAAQAIQIAAKAVPDGQPLAIELKSEPGRLAFGVKLLQGKHLRVVLVDVRKREMLSVAEEPLPLALWTFDAAERGQSPPDLLARETHPGPRLGTWQVTADPSAPTAPNVLALTTDEPNATFNVALFAKPTYTDLDLRVGIKANSGKQDQGGGLVWRCHDENNYYVCRINPLEGNFRVYKVVDGRRQQLQSAEFKVETGLWYQVRAVMVGDQITCYVDGQRYLDVRDDTLKDAGLIGLWTKADASSSFDDLAVYAPPGAQREPERQPKRKTSPHLRHSEESAAADDEESCPKRHVDGLRGQIPHPCGVGMTFGRSSAIAVLVV